MSFIVSTSNIQIFFVCLQFFTQKRVLTPVKTIKSLNCVHHFSKSQFPALLNISGIFVTFLTIIVQLPKQNTVNFENIAHESIYLDLHIIGLAIQ